MYNYTTTLSAAETWMRMVPRRPLWHNAEIDWCFESIVQHTDGVLKLRLSVPKEPTKTKEVPIVDIRDAANSRGSVIAVLDEIYKNMFERFGIPAPPIPARN